MGKLGDKLTQIGISFVERGSTGFLRSLDSEAQPYIPENVKQFIAESDLPDDMKRFLLPLAEFGAHSPLGQFALLAIGLAMGLAFGIAGPITRLGTYDIDKQLHSARFTPETCMELYRRLPDEERSYEWLRKELSDLGFNQERISLLYMLSRYIPTASDLVTWMAREVFEPDAIEKYGLEDEKELVDFSRFREAGIKPEDALNYWKAHWVHTSFSQMIELLHRGLLTGDRAVPPEPTTAAEWEQRDAQDIEQLYEWYRLVEITPFWRNLLTEAVWNVPTRVDVRRWWDMRTINEDELRAIYHRMGYHGKDLDNYILWTKVYVAFPDLLARMSNGWISSEQVLAELISLGMPEDRAKELLETKLKKTAGMQAVEQERSLTKTEIYTGVKKGVIDWDTGVLLLQDLGYSWDVANYILAIRVGATSSPETPSEYRQLTQAWRKAVGLPYTEIPSELLELDAELKRETLELTRLQTEEPDSPAIPVVTSRVLELQTRRRELERLYSSSSSSSSSPA